MNIDGLQNIELMEEVEEIFNFDQVIIADVMHTPARPKVHDYENYLTASLKML